MGRAGRKQGEEREHRKGGWEGEGDKWDRIGREGNKEGREGEREN
jgi:hypothetical protein